MIYNKFKDLEMSLLGFGAMRLPLLFDEQSALVDEDKVFEMVHYAHEHGVNYYDTAYPYHGGKSETILGKALKQFPRESYYLATKYPGHQISETYYPEEIFEKQLQKCDVNYFDFYLLHNVYENSIQTYLDPKWGIVDYFLEQKKRGRIRHLGFSSHGQPDNLARFLDVYGEQMAFCQIQMNYVDWSLQEAEAKYKLLRERNIPIWVMEPVRGGKLAQLPEETEKRLKSLRPDETMASWAFRWLQGLAGVKMILSGMSNMEQIRDNISTFTVEKPLSEDEVDLLFEIASDMKNSIPCTACRYCCDDCPKGLDIPKLLSYYNDVRFSPSINISMSMDAIPEEKHPSACISCGKCSKICPQNINIPAAMADFEVALSKLPSWIEICRERAEAAK